MDNEYILPYKGPENGLVLKNNRLIEIVSAENITLHPMNRTHINTGITLYLTDKYTGIISNNNIQAGNGIIMPHGSLFLNGVCDLRIMLFNLGPSTYRIKAGITKIAELTLVRGLSINKEITLNRTI